FGAAAWRRRKTSTPREGSRASDQYSHTPPCSQLWPGSHWSSWSHKLRHVPCSHAVPPGQSRSPSQRKVHMPPSQWRASQQKPPPGHSRSLSQRPPTPEPQPTAEKTERANARESRIERVMVRLWADREKFSSPRQQRENSVTKKPPDGWLIGSGAWIRT